MATKTSGTEFKRFYKDSQYWPKDTYHEDVVFRINGDELPDDKDPGEVLDTDVVSIEGGIVMYSPLYNEGSEPSVEAYFRHWKRQQTSTAFVVECDITKLKAVEAAIKAAGGRVLKK